MDAERRDPRSQCRPCYLTTPFSGNGWPHVRQLISVKYRQSAVMGTWRRLRDGNLYSSITDSGGVQIRRRMNAWPNRRFRALDDVSAARVAPDANRVCMAAGDHFPVGGCGLPCFENGYPGICKSRIVRRYVRQGRPAATRAKSYPIFPSGDWTTRSSGTLDRSTAHPQEDQGQPARLPGNDCKHPKSMDRSLSARREFWHPSSYPCKSLFAPSCLHQFASAGSVAASARPTSQRQPARGPLLRRKKLDAFM